MYIEKIQKGWKELDSEIIKTGKCVYCGACGAFCANIKFDTQKEIPIEDGSCEEVNTCRDGYGFCYNICPKTEIETISSDLMDKWVFGKEHDKILGHFIKIVSARVADSAREKLPSEAGTITALLWNAMEESLIDASILTDNDEDFHPFPMIAENQKDLFKSIGYKPSQSPTLSLLGEAINKGFADIAVVGTPCQIQALRKLQNHPRFDFEAYDLVSLAIGTFCFGTFHNQQLDEIFQKFNINPGEITKIESDHDHFKLKVISNSDIKEIPLNHLYDKAIRNACFACSDYTAAFADISVGEVGSEDGWNTVIIRTKRGMQIYDSALNNGILEEKALIEDNKELVLDITRNKTDINTIESIVEHSPELKSFYIRNARIAKAYRPGNFVVLWIPDVDFLPMSLSNIEGNLLEITVQKIGEGTSKLFKMQVGDKIGLRGPFGNAWNYEDATNILVTGGGVGIAAITTLIDPLKKNKKNVFVAIGAKDEASLIFADRLIDWIPNTMCTTDDGSRGKKCFVTEAIEDIIKKENIDLIMTCGPEIMMKRVLEIAENKNIEVQASLERKMKCGVGLCGSCCVGENNDVCVCKDGPIFTSEQLRTFPQFGKYSKE
ncbi:MAG: dihydroorotate dehydrogenase electron transfer subunit [Promethearchaeota archaeon]|nr:MAG: dihydroorotate dehydrogenase electron transfer subunit [Candidatus Lokiarchaeota archaeon]